MGRPEGLLKLVLDLQQPVEVIRIPLLLAEIAHLQDACRDLRATASGHQ
jgi:hypothetical protein